MTSENRKIIGYIRFISCVESKMKCANWLSDKRVNDAFGFRPLSEVGISADYLDLINRSACGLYKDSMK